MYKMIFVWPITSAMLVISIFAMSALFNIKNSKTIINDHEVCVADSLYVTEHGAVGFSMECSGEKLSWQNSETVVNMLKSKTNLVDFGKTTMTCVRYRDYSLADCKL